METAHVGLGTWGLGGRAYGAVSQLHARSVLDAALDAGVRMFDTADIYGDGRAEALLGEALSTRREITLVSKIGYRSERGGKQDFSPNQLCAAARAVVARLRRPPNFLLLHSPPSSVLDDRRVLAAAEELVAEGLAGAVGVSVRSPYDIERAIRWSGCSAVEVLLNLLDQRAIDSGGIARAQASGVSVIARVPLCVGHLTARPPRPQYLPRSDHRLRWLVGQHERWATAAKRFDFLAGETRTLAQAAIAFCAQSPGVTYVIPGATSPGHVRENAAAVRPPARLTAAEYLSARALAPWVEQHAVPSSASQRAARSA
jgi:aryl-alcohol dehydrogenase-like predicted oxidoreductase